RILAGVTAEQIEQFLLHPPSGDWRRIGGNLELVAACSVVTPGFPIVRASAAGVQTSLVAAGARTMQRLARARRGGRRQGDARAQAVDIARELRAFDRRAARADQLAARVGVDPASRLDRAAAR